MNTLILLSFIVLVIAIILFVNYRETNKLKESLVVKVTEKTTGSDKHKATKKTNTSASVSTSVTPEGHSSMTHLDNNYEMANSQLHNYPHISHYVNNDRFSHRYYSLPYPMDQDGHMSHTRNIGQPCDRSVMSVLGDFFKGFKDSHVTHTLHVSPSAIHATSAPTTSMSTTTTPATTTATPATATPSTKVISTNGRCGPDHGGAICPPGQFCSQWSYCGPGQEYSENSQPAYNGSSVTPAPPLPSASKAPAPAPATTTPATTTTSTTTTTSPSTSTSITAPSTTTTAAPISTCDINGLWHGISNNQITGSVYITQTGNSFNFSASNGGASQGSGSFTSQNTIKGTYMKNAVTGTLSDDCKVINWSNGGVWHSASYVAPVTTTATTATAASTPATATTATTSTGSEIVGKWTIGSTIITIVTGSGSNQYVGTAQTTVPNYWTKVDITYNPSSKNYNLEFVYPTTTVKETAVLSSDKNTITQSNKSVWNRMTTSTSTSSSSVTAASGYVPIGPFKDWVNSKRAMNVTIGNNAPNYSAKTCSLACKAYKYFGLQDPGPSGSQCFCSNDIAATTQFGKDNCGETGAPNCNYVYANNTNNSNYPTNSFMSYLAGYPGTFTSQTSYPGGAGFSSLDEALNQCDKTSDCGGVTLSPGQSAPNLPFSMRKGTKPIAFDGDLEVSWVKK